MSASNKYKARNITWAQDTAAQAVELYRQLTIETLIHKLRDDDTGS